MATKKNRSLQSVRDKIDCEVSMEYVFINYSSFPEIKDKEFHRLQEKFVQAHKELEAYINARSVGEYD